NVADRHHIDILRGAAADEHLPFVARADDADADWVFDRLIAEAHPPQPRAGPGPRGDDSFQKVAARDAQRVVIVLLTDLPFFRCEVHRLAPLLAPADGPAAAGFRPQHIR